MRLEVSLVVAPTVSTRRMIMAAASAGPRLVDAATQTKLEGKHSPVRASWAAIKAEREGSTEFICGRHTQLQELVHSETQLPKQVSRLRIIRECEVELVEPHLLSPKQMQSSHLTLTGGEWKQVPAR